MKEILTLLGVQTEAEALASIVRINTFLEATRTATGRSSFEDVLSHIRSNGEVLGKVLAATGADSLDKALGAIAAMKDAKDQLATVQQDKAALEAEKRDKAAEQLIANAIAGEGEFSKPCLTPANRERALNLYKAHGADTLKAYLDSLPPVALSGESPTPPASRGDAPSAAALDPKRPLTAEDREAMKALGIDEPTYRQNLELAAKA